MNWPLVFRSRYDDAHALYEKQVEKTLAAEKNRDSAIGAAATAARLFAEADAANTRLDGRVTELGRRLEQDTDGEYVTQLEARVHRLVRGAARYLDALWAVRAEVLALTGHVEKVNQDLIAMTKRAQAAEARARQAEIHSASAVEEAKRPIDGGTMAASSEEARLRSELYRSEKARAALDEQLRSLQFVNEVQARELRELAEKAREASAS